MTKVTITKKEEYDEHVWTSIRNAERMSASIADELMSVDSKNSKYYNDKKTNYISQLDSLDKKFTKVANNKSVIRLFSVTDFRFCIL